MRFSPFCVSSNTLYLIPHQHRKHQRERYNHNHKHEKHLDKRQQHLLEHHHINPEFWELSHVQKQNKPGQQHGERSTNVLTG